MVLTAVLDNLRKLSAPTVCSELVRHSITISLSVAFLAAQASTVTLNQEIANLVMLVTFVSKEQLPRSQTLPSKMVKFVPLDSTVSKVAIQVLLAPLVHTVPRRVTASSTSAYLAQ